MTFEIGLSAEVTHVVTEDDTAATYGSGLAPVLSTPHLVALMENAAQAALNPHMAEGQSAVGTHIDMRHLAATPVGMDVRVRAELQEVEGRRLRFHIEAWDEVEKIGEATHERFIIDMARFMRGVEEKRGALMLNRCCEWFHSDEIVGRSDTPATGANFPRDSVEFALGASGVGAMRCTIPRPAETDSLWRGRAARHPKMIAPRAVKMVEQDDVREVR